MTAISRCKLVSPTLVCLAVLGLYTNVAMSQSKTSADGNSPRQFVVKTIVVIEKPLVSFEIKGELRWISRSPDKSEYELRFRQINFSSDLPEGYHPKGIYTIEALHKIIPFVARIGISNSARVPVKMNITEGKMNKATNDEELGDQYSWAMRVSDMMLLAPVKKTITTNAFTTPGTQTGLTTEYADKLDIPDLGVVRFDLFRERNTPTKFAIYPRFDGTVAKTSDLVNFEVDGRVFNYYYRLLDVNEGIASHAINMHAALGEQERMKDMDYAKWLSLLSQPQALSEYFMLELTLENPKESRSR